MKTFMMGKGTKSKYHGGSSNRLNFHSHVNLLLLYNIFIGATVKAVTQERGTEHVTEVMWFYTGNYTELMQEVKINGSFPVATSCNSTAIFRRPSN